MPRSNDPAATDHLIAIVEDGGLARSDGTLGLVKDSEHLSVNSIGVSICS
jgi:hypothetical protein